MDDLMKSITDSVAHQAAEKRYSMSPSSPLPPIDSDRLALEQIFSNLIDNALKYTQPGRPGHILISGRTKHGQGDLRD